MTLEAIKYTRGNLEVLDQLLLPTETSYIPVKNTADGWQVIHSMQVRGAPAIAIVSCLSLAVEFEDLTFKSKDHLCEQVTKKLEYLVTARPTAVNMRQAAEYLTMLAKELVADESIDTRNMKQRIVESIEQMLVKDLADNKAIGDHGASHILQHCQSRPVQVITHCNTGSLATSGYGTALGVIRSLHASEHLEQVFCTETRPYNQGARLTAYELVHDQIPATLICDSMAAALMKSKQITAIVVGADRVVANGDTANKIGTYQLAILAKYHGVPFYVAAPYTTIDFNLKTGDCIPIEERPHKEMTHVQGTRIAAPGINCWNPAFDITPADLITGGIITEIGVFPSHKIPRSE